MTPGRQSAGTSPASRRRERQAERKAKSRAAAVRRPYPGGNGHGAAGPAPEGRLCLSREPLGYRIGEHLVEGFPDDLRLTQGQRLRIAGWARALAPGSLTETQRGLLDGFQAEPSAARARAEEESSYRASPIWGLLDESQRRLVEEPSAHPALAGVGYPLRTAQLATLVEASDEQIRYWNEVGLLPARRTAGGQRRFYAAAAMRAFLLRGIGQPNLAVLRALHQGGGREMLLAIAMVLQEQAPEDDEERRELLLDTAANLEEIGLTSI
jgi:DNA-binding transcriptional MerR regulator